MANSVDPDQMPLWHLIWVYTFFSCLYLQILRVATAIFSHLFCMTCLILNLYVFSFNISATFWKKVKLLLKPRSDTLHALLTEDKYKWIWNIVNFVPFLKDFVMKRVYISKFFHSSR